MSRRISRHWDFRRTKYNRNLPHSPGLEESVGAFTPGGSSLILTVPKGDHLPSGQERTWVGAGEDGRSVHKCPVFTIPDFIVLNIMGRRTTKTLEKKYPVKLNSLETHSLSESFVWSTIRPTFGGSVFYWCAPTPWGHISPTLSSLHYDRLRSTHNPPYAMTPAPSLKTEVIIVPVFTWP